MAPGPDQTPAAGDTAFVGSIPDVYERLLVPLIFEEPAERIASRVAEASPTTLLETAAGTGVVTRALARVLPGAAITATDLNESMLDEARLRSPDLASVTWRQADALALPFADDAFEAVVCQFGVMFFPDRVAGYVEAGRVLSPGGTFAFSVWDGVHANPFPATVVRALAEAAPDSPPEFLVRTPYGHFDTDRIRDELAAAGFEAEIDVCAGTNRASVIDIATAFCQGTPFRLELDAHPQLGSERATEIVAAALEKEFGSGVIEAPASWIQIVASPRG